METSTHSNHPNYTARRGRLAIWAAVALLLGGPNLATADYETVAFGVEEYAGPGECGQGPPLDYTWDMAQSWDLYMETVADYDVATKYANDNVDPEDFIDYYDDEGTSPTGTDWADVVFFAGHGRATCDALNDGYTTLMTGDDVGVDCEVRIGGSTNEVVFGSGGSSSDANMMFMHASESLAHCVVEDAVIDDIDDGEAGTQFTLLAGFHNSPDDEGSNPGEIEAFIGNSVTNDVGWSWIYVLANRDEDNNAECTSLVITSSSLSNANNLFNNGGLKDLKDTGTHSTYWYYSNCGDTCGDNDACG